MHKREKVRGFFNQESIDKKVTKKTSEPVVVLFSYHGVPKRTQEGFASVAVEVDDREIRHLEPSQPMDLKHHPYHSTFYSLNYYLLQETHKKENVNRHTGRRTRIISNIQQILDILKCFRFSSAFFVKRYKLIAHAVSVRVSCQIVASKSKFEKSRDSAYIFFNVIYNQKHDSLIFTHCKTRALPKSWILRKFGETPRLLKIDLQLRVEKFDHEPEKAKLYFRLRVCNRQRRSLPRVIRAS